MAKLAKIAMRKRTQKEIDAAQDETNARQDRVDYEIDRTNERQDLVNTYQSVALVVYGVCLLGIFLVALFAGVLK